MIKVTVLCTVLCQAYHTILIPNQDLLWGYTESQYIELTPIPGILTLYLHGTGIGPGTVIANLVCDSYSKSKDLLF